MIALAEPGLDDLLDVGRRMRLADRREIGAVAPHRSIPDQVAAIAASSSLVVIVVSSTGERVAAMGAALAAPHLACCWMFGTPTLDHPAQVMARARVHLGAVRLHQELDRMGVRRCVVQPASSNLSALIWLRRLGYVREGVHPRMGAHGEAFETWGRVL